ncbi:DUF58 domain-containing protein [Modestobacter sp. L9-4]|uniref:DUF58 domain-containing protein n=1 Tax=Modestobacter sp. L9-4 TaxID=2851567 RepID=UPI001C74BF5C|nr:DUF58 domain-containing protein [Modestobacter sp. L9-4]QXG76797.1 DUF58 domain-containing protein [Modestobacter sp. L9-4]
MSWQPTAALLRVSVLPAVTAVVAVLAHRPDLLAIAAPLAVAALPLVRRPGSAPAAELDVDDETPAEGSDLQAVVRLTGVAGAETVTAAVPTPGWVRSRTGRRPAGVVAPVGDHAELPFDLTAARWGRSDVGPATVSCSAAGGLLRWGPAVLPARRVRVLPVAEPHRGATLLPRARTGTGLHRSPRPGESSELNGVRVFAPGDRMRRVNWRVSLRSGELHVNATTSERNADVLVLLDARYDAGVSGGLAGRASGVDAAVRATAALTEFYLGLGDRVGLIACSSRLRQLPARGGRGQLQAVLAALLDVSAPRLGGAEPALPEPVGIDPQALVLVVSPLVGTRVFDRAAALGRGGHTVVVLDTLPDDAGPTEVGPWTAPALRLWRLERSTRIAQLTALGVPVVPWRGASSLDQTLLELTRAAARR